MTTRDKPLVVIGVGFAELVAFVTVVLLVVIVLGADAGAQADPPDVATRAIDVQYRPPDEVLVPVIVDELESETVLTIRARGFEANRTGEVRQCRTGERFACRNRLAVRFDGDGAAVFQYLVSSGGGCRLGDERCTLEIRVGDTLSVIDTVFVDKAPPRGRITLTPSSGLRLGDTVTVSASEFPSRASLTINVCAAPATRGPRCGAPGPVVELEIDETGGGSAEIVLDVGKVGADRVACGRQTICFVVVTSDEAVARALPVRLKFVAAPGAAYDAERLVIGIVAAIALGLGAVGLVRSTDWAAPREADGHEIDEVDYADLDLEADRSDQTQSLSTRTDATTDAPLC